MRFLPLLALLLSSAALPSVQDESDVEAKPYKLNQIVREELILQDLKGHEHKLFEEYDGMVLVLVWWSLRDPSCRIYEKRLAALQQEFEKDVQILFIESNYDELFHPSRDPLERLRFHVKKTKLKLPLLIDYDNRLADDFKALAANHAFIIDRKRHVRYFGGIDDDHLDKKTPETTAHWLKSALVEVIDGKIPVVPWTRPKGRRISRAKKQGAAGGR